MIDDLESVAEIGGSAGVSALLVGLQKILTGWLGSHTPAYTGEKVPQELLPLLVSPEWWNGARSCGALGVDLSVEAA
jgi:hypothetical protein